MGPPADILYEETKNASVGVDAHIDPPRRKARILLHISSFLPGFFASLRMTWRGHRPPPKPPSDTAIWRTTTAWAHQIKTPIAAMKLTLCITDTGIEVQNARSLFPANGR